MHAMWLYGGRDVSGSFLNGAYYLRNRARLTRRNHRPSIERLICWILIAMDAC